MSESATVRVRYELPDKGRDKGRTKTLCRCIRDSKGEWALEQISNAGRAQRAMTLKASEVTGLSGDQSEYWARVAPPGNTIKFPVVVADAGDRVLFHPDFVVAKCKLSAVLDKIVAAGLNEIEYRSLRRAIDHL